MKVFHSISHEEAQRVLDLAMQYAAEDGGDPVAAAVVDAFGAVVCSARMNGAKAVYLDYAIAKAQTAVAHECHTAQFLHHLEDLPGIQSDQSNGIWVEGGPNAWTELDIAIELAKHPWFNPWAGGVLLKHSFLSQCEGVCIIGALGVSARASLDDHALAQKANKAVFAHIDHDSTHFA